MSDEVVRLTLRLPKGLHNELHRMAEQNNRSVHKQILALLSQFSQSSSGAKLFDIQQRLERIERKLDKEKTP